MPRPTTRAEVLQKLRDTISKNEIIVGAGAGGCDPYVSTLKHTSNELSGIGLSAKSVEKGGCDIIVVYNSGRFRMAGRGSLAGMMPYGDANQIVVEMVSCNGTYSIQNGNFNLNRQVDNGSRQVKSSLLWKIPPC